MNIADLFITNANAIGLFGVGLLLVAYFLLNTNKLFSKDLSYQLLNFFGAALILFSLFFSWNWPAALIEISWMGISLIGVYHYIKRHYHKKKHYKK